MLAVCGVTWAITSILLLLVLLILLLNESNLLLFEVASGPNNMAVSAERERKKIYPTVQKFGDNNGVDFFLKCFFKEVFYKGCIYLIKYVKQFKHLYLNIFYNLIHHAKVEFSVTWWFCDQETFLLFSTLKNVFNA